MAPYRVLVTGSRDWQDTDTICTALDEALDHAPDRLLVIHGGCPTGADHIAGRWATAAMVPFIVYPANWEQHGRAAGPIRNMRMVEDGADLCLAFIKNGSRGASHTARLADAAGITVRKWTA
ncbi:DUF2493 domain-containing protein [Streptomyces murinus]|uniref:DUF2493 domain-containing protein n=1 Tax=Streptomyces murinus TaxID=33900 RepID=UPI0018F5BA9D|nr:DUF2493 domain-containing protein [Streptomyces murinus]